MLAFVDLEHENVRQDPVKGPPHLRDYYQRVVNIATAVGMPCKPVHYLDCSLDWLHANNIQGLFIGGNTTDWDGYDWEEFRPLQEAVRSGIPTIGLCGGHQFVAITFGAECGPLGPLGPGEEDPMPEYKPGMRKERGYLPLQILARNHRLFAEFPASGPVIMESHYWEIYRLPEGFDLLASTPWCRIQVIQHRELPVYGTQGHPEAYTDDYPDGKRLLRNFAVATGIIQE